MHTKSLLDTVQHEKIAYQASRQSLTLKEKGFLDSIRESLNAPPQTFLHRLNGTGEDGKKKEGGMLPFPAEHWHIQYRLGGNFMCSY